MTISIYTLENKSYAYVNGKEALSKYWFVALLKAILKRGK